MPRIAAARRERGGGGAEREDHRRAHQHQSQQGGAHRPPAQRRAGRHVRAHAARRAANASRCRTTSTTPACRWPTWSSASTTWNRRRPPRCGRCIADPAVRFDYLLLGSLRAHVRLLRGPSGSAAPGAARRCTPSKRARAKSPSWRTWWPMPSSRRTSPTMLRLGVEYDVLPRESEILHLQFWATAFELLKERKAIYFETEGKNAGCWVMPRGLRRRRSEDSKVIVRSNGTVTYVGKDIAYQLWKFGLLGKDFYYRPFQTYAGRPRAVGRRRTEPQPTARPAVRPRHARLQRDRFAAIVSAGRGGGGAARAGLQRAGGAIHALLLRDGGALAALLRGAGHRAVGGRPQAAVRRSLRPQGARREGRRPDRQADREGAGRSGLAAPRRCGGEESRTWPRRSRSARCAISC